MREKGTQTYALKEFGAVAGRMKVNLEMSDLGTLSDRAQSVDFSVSSWSSVDEMGEGRRT